MGPESLDMPCGSGTAASGYDGVVRTAEASPFVPAGTSVWELCCIGVPTAVAWVVDNQREGYDRVVGAGAAIGQIGRAHV